MERELPKLLYEDFDAHGTETVDRPELLQQVLSRNPSHRIHAVQSLKLLPRNQYFWFALKLLKDEEPAVRQATLAALGYADCAAFARELVKAVDNIESRRVATALLVALGPPAISTICDCFPNAGKRSRIRLLRVLDRIAGSSGVALVANELAHADECELSATLQALGADIHCVDVTLLPVIERQLHVEVQQANHLSAVLADLGAASSDLPAVHLLKKVVETHFARCRQRLQCCISILVGSQAQSDPLTALATLRLSPPRLDLTQRLIQMLELPQPINDSWLWVCAAAAAQQLNLTDSRILAALSAARDRAGQDRLMQEAATRTLESLRSRNRNSRRSPQSAIQTHTESCPEAETTMLSTIEKVMLLKGVNLFFEVPDPILIEVASLLEEADVTTSTVIFDQGASADCMYIIVGGRVKIHDGENILNYQSSGDVFGELALLDAAPRLASVTALEDTRLLRLDQEGFYLLMEDHIEFTRGVIRVLSGYLRGNLRPASDREYDQHLLGKTADTDSASRVQ